MTLLEGTGTRPRSSALLPVRCNSEGDYPSWPAAQLPVHEERRISAEQPQPTAAHRTITTARRPDHIRLSALVRSPSTQFMAHTSCQLGRGPLKRGHFPAILVGFFQFCFFVWETFKYLFTLDVRSNLANLSEIFFKSELILVQNV